MSSTSEAADSIIKKKIIDKNEYRWCPLCSLDNLAVFHDQTYKPKEAKMYRLKFETSDPDFFGKYYKNVEFYICLGCGFEVNLANRTRLDEYLEGVEIIENNKSQ
jgi:hypothetical protein